MVGNRRHIPDELKWLAVKMATQGRSRREIEHITGIAKSTQTRLRRLERLAGKVSIKALVCGRPRILTAMDINVCYVLFIVCAINYNVSV